MDKKILWILAALILLLTAGSASAQYAYAMREQADVMIIDTSKDVNTYEKIITDPEGSESTWDAAFTPDGSKAYVTTSDGIVVIDTKTKAVIKTINSPFGYGAFGQVVMAPDGKTVYVNDGFFVAVIDTSLDEILYYNQEGCSDGTSSTGMAISSDSQHQYVAIQDVDGAGVLAIEDCYAPISLNIVSIGQCPRDVAVTPDDKKVYVGGSDNVFVVDTTTYEVKTLSIGQGTYYLAMAPDGKKVYVGAYGKVYVLDTATDAVIDTINMAGKKNSLGSDSMGIAVTLDGKKVYNSVDGGAVVIGTSNNRVIGTIDIPCNSGSIVMMPDNGAKAEKLRFEAFDLTQSSTTAPLMISYHVKITGSLAKMIWTWDYNGESSSQTEYASGDYEITAAIPAAPGTYRLTCQAFDINGKMVTKSTILNVIES